MASLRNVVTFVADFPDDGLWDKQGNRLAPAGRTVASAIRERLREAKLDVSELGQQGDYGWSFYIQTASSKVQFLLAECDVGWAASLDERRPLMTRLRSSPNTDELRGLLARLQTTLQGDRRFSMIRWHTRDDFDHARDDRSTPSP
jgi:hypothetical protein